MRFFKIARHIKTTIFFCCKTFQIATQQNTCTKFSSQVQYLECSIIITNFCANKIGILAFAILFKYFTELKN